MSTENNNENNFFDLEESSMGDVDFFSIEEEAAPEGTPEDPAPGTEEEEEEEEDDNLFAEVEEGEEGKPTKNGKPGEEEITGESTSTLSFLQDKGFIEYELGEGETLTEERAEEILEDGLDSLFESRIEELFEDVPDVVKQMNKFVLKGGNIHEFLDAIAVQNQTGLKEGMDLTEESNQEAVIRHGLAEEGYDEEYIKAQIEFLKDSDRLEKHATTHFKKWDNKRKAEQSAILESRAKNQEEEKRKRRALKNEVSSFLKENENITGYAITKKDIKALPNYMSDRTVKLDNGGQITNMQKDLMRVLNSPTGSVQMAKLLQAADEDGILSFKEISENTETKVVKKVRDNVRRNKKGINTQSGEVRKNRKLADYFD